MKRNIILSLILGVFCLFTPAQAAESLYYNEAALDEMIGQMIIVGFKGNSPNSRGFKNVVKDLNNGKISGVIFFEDNIKNPETLKLMTKEIYSARMQLRPFISIDMEGGKVQRMNSKNGFKDYPSAAEISKLDSKKAYETYADMAETLSGSLFNLNFAPCVDLDLNEKSILHTKERTYSKNPATVALYANEMIKAHYEKNIITVLKHFPGYGSVSEDIHLYFADATDTYKETELAPYETLAFKNNLQMVMSTHLFNKNFDEIYPATLSYSTVSELLRTQIGYDGVVITDDLDMGAIKKNYDLEETVIQAINAGNDILLFSNRVRYNPNLADEVSRIIKNAITEGLIQPSRIQESYERVVKLKTTLVSNEPK